MLNKLSIKNFALIEKTEIEFNRGLNILSGETGAGKSILLEALNFVLGAKADKVLIRNGEEECIVSAEFDISSNVKVKQVLKEFDFDDEDILILSRKMTIDSKNSIKLNGNSVTLSMLKKITRLLVDIHGQSEHFFLLETKNQLELIDKFGGDYVSHIKSNLSTLFDKYRNVLKSIDELGGDESKREITLDILNYQIKEIESADLKENEEEELLENKKKINNLQKINEALSSVCQGINDEGNIGDIFSNIVKVFSLISSFSSEYGELYERLCSCQTEIEDISSTAESYLDILNDNELNIAEIESRLDLIKTLKRKYGNSYSEIIDFLTNARIEKERLENFNELSEKYIKEKERLEDEIFSLYQDLTKERKKASKIFIKNVTEELVDLGFNNSLFEIRFNDEVTKENRNYVSKNGIDNVEFMFSANVGEPVKPLSTVISGGEVSRFMLAIKAQTAKYNDINTFIFDEIDTGISGQIAKVVAKKFNKISNATQIIAITHLPQIFVMGDTNFLIQKYVQNGKTISTIKKLEKQDKMNEMVRLIGGEKDSASAISLANELIQEAEKFKKMNN